MHAGKNFGLLEAIIWTRRDIYKFIIISSIPTALYALIGWTWLSIPWLPLALIGTAVAFIVGFKNNATYDRMWEARKIWGSIINNSRTWGIMVKDFITNKHATKKLSDQELKSIHQRIIYRHLGWLTALRYQLRQPKSWESMSSSYNKEYKKYFKVPEEQIPLEEELKKYLSKEDIEYILSKKNRATQTINRQSSDLKELLHNGYIEDFRHMELQNMLKAFYDEQGKSERIKNFPYPRQFATLNLYFVWLFVILLPFGMLSEFDKLGDHFVWLTIPFATLVSWVFKTMERIGESTENPFQGGANDIPISNIAQVIEVDLREMLDETNLPEVTAPVNNILM